MKMVDDRNRRSHSMTVVLGTTWTQPPVTDCCLDRGTMSAVVDTP